MHKYYFPMKKKQCISLINQVIRNIYILEDIIGQAKARLEKKIDKRISMSDMNTLFELSYGPNRTVAERIKRQMQGDIFETKGK